MPRSLLAAFTVLAVVGVPGCNGSDERSPEGSATVAAQVKRFYAALAQGNGEVACNLLTKEAANGFEAVLSGRVARDCSANVATLSRRSVLRGSPEVTVLSTPGGTAAAHVTFTDPPLESDVLLRREDGVWKLAQIPAVVERLGR